MKVVGHRRNAGLPVAVIALTVFALFGTSAQGADQVFWANFVSNKISHANIDGSGGVVNLNTTGATANEPTGLAIDPVGGRVYWANHTGGKISWANLDGSGGGDLETGTATVSGPTAVAIDVAARRIYWLNQGANKVSCRKTVARTSRRCCRRREGRGHPRCRARASCAKS